MTARRVLLLDGGGAFCYLQCPVKVVLCPPKDGSVSWELAECPIPIRQQRPSRIPHPHFQEEGLEIGGGGGENTLVPVLFPNGTSCIASNI